MERLIKDNDIILDGTKTRYEKEHDAFQKLEIIEQIMANHEINNLSELDNACEYFIKEKPKVSNIACLVAKKHNLNEFVPCDYYSIVYVIGKNHSLTLIAPTQRMTWKQLIEKSAIDFQQRHSLRSSLLVIIENAKKTTIYKFGSVDRTYIYEQGIAKGYSYGTSENKT